MRVDLKSEPEILSMVVAALLQNAIDVATQRSGGRKPSDKAVYGATREQNQIWMVVARENNWNLTGWKEFVKTQFGVDI